MDGAAADPDRGRRPSADAGAHVFHGGKLRLLYYDLREDVSQLFGPLHRRAADPERARRPASGTRWMCSWRRRCRARRRRSRPRGVSDYARGFLPGSTDRAAAAVQPAQPAAVPAGRGAVHGRLHRPGAGAAVRAERRTERGRTTPAPAAASCRTPSGPTTATCGAPADGNWANYTPVTRRAVGTDEPLRPDAAVPPCVAGPGRDAQPEHLHGAGDRRAVRLGAGRQQARSTAFSARSSSWPRTRPRRCRGPTGCTIENQPFGGQASFLQFGAPLTTLDVSTPALSSVARTVFVTSQDRGCAHPGIGDRGRRRRRRHRAEWPDRHRRPQPGSENPVLQNPVLQNPSLQNPSLQNIADAEHYNPSITSARVGVPSLQNPALQNPTLQNPSLQNPSIQNPFLQDPSPAESVVAEPDAPERRGREPEHRQRRGCRTRVCRIRACRTRPCRIRRCRTRPEQRGVQRYQLGDHQRGQYDGVLHDQPAAEPAGAGGVSHPAAAAQDVHDAGGRRLHVERAGAHDPAGEYSRTRSSYTDPANPNLQNPSLQNPSLQNPTLALGPGESATITYRVVDPNIFDGVTYDASAAVTPAAVAQSVNTEDVGRPRRPRRSRCR